jgi:hypothetical protein
MGNYDQHDSFGSAFKAAHNAAGSGHTFTYKDKMYTTDCKDGGDYRKVPDSRDSSSHLFSQRVH